MKYEPDDKSFEAFEHRALHDPDYSLIYLCEYTDPQIVAFIAKEHNHWCAEGEPMPEEAELKSMLGFLKFFPKYWNAHATISMWDDYLDQNGGAIQAFMNHFEQYEIPRGRADSNFYSDPEKIREVRTTWDYLRRIMDPPEIKEAA